MTKHTLAALAIAAFALAPLTAFAAVDKADIENYCSQEAKEKGVAADKLAGYIADCIAANMKAEKEVESGVVKKKVQKPEDPMISGDEPMNVEDAAQIKAPDPSAGAQAKTEKMLKGEAAEVSGDMPMNADDAAQIKAPDPSAGAQAKTEKMLKGEAAEVSGDMPMNADDAAQIKAPK
ncbi:MAG: hypothetical protein LJE70_12725 [Chromatiaceae bacterium]|jgi:non-ribosomal peptide synthetase component E (peptide arylation enzyme)|nr:hypothetical protein [Chromatiaceae bacterium]